MCIDTNKLRNEGVSGKGYIKSRRRELTNNPPGDLDNVIRLLIENGFCTDKDHSFTRIDFNSCSDIINKLLWQRNCKLHINFLILEPNFIEVIYVKKRFHKIEDLKRAIQQAKATQ